MAYVEAWRLRVEKVTDILKEGQEVEVLVLDVDNRGRIKLSIKDVAATIGRLSLPTLDRFNVVKNAP